MQFECDRSFIFFQAHFIGTVDQHIILQSQHQLEFTIYSPNLIKCKYIRVDAFSHLNKSISNAVHKEA